MATLYSESRKTRKDTTVEPIIEKPSTFKQKQTDVPNEQRQSEAHERSNRLIKKLKNLDDLKSKSDYVPAFHKTQEGDSFIKQYP